MTKNKNRLETIAMMEGYEFLGSRLAGGADVQPANSESVPTADPEATQPAGESGESQTLNTK